MKNFFKDYMRENNFFHKILIYLFLFHLIPIPIYANEQSKTISYSFINNIISVKVTFEETKYNKILLCKINLKNLLEESIVIYPRLYLENYENKNSYSINIGKQVFAGLTFPLYLKILNSNQERNFQAHVSISNEYTDLFSHFFYIKESDLLPHIGKRNEVYRINERNVEVWAHIADMYLKEIHLGGIIWVEK